jgi:hypothetical protein
MPNRKALEMEPGSGNVFADLGLSDAGEHLIKAGLVVKMACAKPVRRNSWVSISPRFQRCCRASSGGHSVEHLMRFLAALGTM